MQVHHPQSIAEAVEAVADGATPLAGGTDLMVEANMGGRRPDHVVGLRRVEDLKSWEGNRIGAAVSWRRLERGGPRALAQAARTVGSPQIRNAGTIGGNLATASPAGDGHPYLAAIGASIELTSLSGSRLVPWDRFFTGVKKTSMDDGELITAVVLPDAQPEKQEFAKVGVRNAMVISTVCAVVTRADDDSTAVALGSVAPTPIRVPAAEEMISSIARPTSADLEEFQRLVAVGVSPITDHRSTEEYRRRASGVLARRLLERCLR